MNVHWRAPAPPATTGVDLQIDAVPLPAGWNDALARPAAVTTHAISLEHAPPRVVTIPIVRPTVRVRGFVFPEPARTLPMETAKPLAAANLPSPACGRGRG